MKILFVVDTYFSNNNGTSISAQRFAEGLRSRGHEVEILTAGQEGQGPFIVPPFYVPIVKPLMEKQGFVFAKFWGKKRMDIIKKAVEWADIVHCFLPYALEIKAQRYATQLGKPSTGAFHLQPQNITSSLGIGKVDWVNNLLFSEFRRHMYNDFRHVHAPSRFMADEIVKRGYTAKMHVISNGIHNDFVYTKREKQPEYQGKILIMMIGRLAMEKRQDVIINAVQYSKYKDKIQLLFAGKGPKYNDYVELGKSLKNPPKFLFLTREQLIDTLAQCDLYVHASDMESEAISCIEAFATGLVPVIANSKVSATPQFALDERSLFEPGNPKDLARVIDFWLDNREERERMEKVYAASADNYRLENSLRLFEEMLNEEIEDNAKHNRLIKDN